MIYLSICSRTKNKPYSLERLLEWAQDSRNTVQAFLTMDASSIYDGHKENLSTIDACYGLEDDDIIVLCHDDVEILETPLEFSKNVSLCLRKEVGMVGVAGATNLKNDAVWWTTRQDGTARGFVFQGKNKVNMTPNYFGPVGQVIVMDGCLMACRYEVLKSLNLLEKPDYLESDWDFYDIHMSTKSFLAGFTNYVAPIIIKHESRGEMRDGWHIARNNFIRRHRNMLPLKLPLEATHGLPS